MTEKKDALTLRGPGAGMVLRTVEDHKKFAMAAFASGFLSGGTTEEDKKKAVATAMMQIQQGAELGLGPMSSIQGIHIIQGRPSLAANTMGALIKASGRYRYKLLEHTEKVCKLEFYELVGRQWDIAGVSVFTLQDAANAGLTSGKNQHSWKKYPRNMLFSRALSNGARWFCSDIFAGAVYTPDEVAEGDAIDTTWTTEAEPVKEQKMSSLMAAPELVRECREVAEDPGLADTMVATQLRRVGPDTTKADALTLLRKAHEFLEEQGPPAEDEEDLPEPPIPEGKEEPGANG